MRMGRRKRRMMMTGQATKGRRGTERMVRNLAGWEWARVNK